MTNVDNTFCPGFKKCGFSPPDVLDPIRDLGDGPKRIYRKLCQRAGDKDHCWPSTQGLANDLGKSVRQVLYDVRRLLDYGLIARRRRGPGKSSCYFILRHPIFETEQEKRGGSA
jgi:hypothetical protein